MTAKPRLFSSVALCDSYRYDSRGAALFRRGEIYHLPCVMPFFSGARRHKYFARLSLRCSQLSHENANLRNDCRMQTKDFLKCCASGASSVIRALGSNPSRPDSLSTPSRLSSNMCAEACHLKAFEPRVRICNRFACEDATAYFSMKRLVDFSDGYE